MSVFHAYGKSSRPNAIAIFDNTVPVGVSMVTPSMVLCTTFHTQSARML
jgi:hypothetical protein